MSSTPWRRSTVKLKVDAAVEHTESATVPGGAPDPGTGKIWVRSDAPNVAMFTDDAGVDHVLSLVEEGTVTNSTLRWNGTQWDENVNFRIPADGEWEVYGTGSGDTTGKFFAAGTLHGEVGLDAGENLMLQWRNGLAAPTGILEYVHTSARWDMVTGGTKRLELDSSGMTLVGTGSDLVVEGTGVSTFAGGVSLNSASPILDIGDLTGSPQMTIDKSDAGQAIVAFRAPSGVGNGRWQFVYTGAEDFDISRQDNTGSTVDTPLSLSATTGDITLANNLAVNGTSTSTFAGAVSLTAAAAQLTIGDGTGTPQLVINKSDAGAGNLDWENAGIRRWRLQADSNEDWRLARYDATEVFLDLPLVVEQATGNVIIANTLTASGLTYPTVDGAAGDILSTDGGGILSLVTLGSLGLPDEGTVTSSTLRWSGTQWVENTGILASSGGNLTLDSTSPTLTVGDGTGLPLLVLDKADGSVAGIQMKNLGLQRWQIHLNATEDLTFRRYDASEVLQDSAMVLSNSTGDVDIANNLNVNGGVLDVATRADIGSPTAGGTAGLRVRDASGRVLFMDQIADMTTKQFRLGLPHYLTAEEAVTAIYMSSNASATEVNIGGGTAVFNAATAINFHTAANNTTVTGTEAGSINNTQSWVIGASGSSTTHVINGSILIGRNSVTDLANKTFEIRGEPFTNSNGSWTALYLQGNSGNNVVRIGHPSVDSATLFEVYTATALDTAGTLRSQWTNAGLLSHFGDMTLDSPSPTLTVGDGTGAPVIDLDKGDLSGGRIAWKSGGTEYYRMFFSTGETWLFETIVTGSPVHSTSYTSAGTWNMPADLNLQSASPTLTVGDGTGQPVITWNKSDTSVSDFNWRVAGVNRWIWRFDSDEFIRLRRYNAVGTLVDAEAVLFDWSTGNVNLANSLTLDSPSPTLTVGDATGSPIAQLRAADAGSATVEWETNNGLYWQAQMGATAQDFLIRRYVANVFQDEPLTILNATGDAAFANRVGVSGATVTDSAPNSDDLVVGDLSGTVGMSLLIGTAAEGWFSVTDVSGVRRGDLRYSDSGQKWVMGMAGVDRYHWTTTKFTGITDNDKALGTLTERWSDLHTVDATIHGNLTTLGGQTWGDGTGGPTLIVNKDDLSFSTFEWRSENVRNWVWFHETDEDLVMKAYSAVGVELGNTFRFPLGTQNVEIGGSLSVNGSNNFFGPTTSTLGSGSGTPVGTLDKYVQIGNDTALEETGFAILSNDGTRNPRAQFFLKDNATSGNGLWGLWQTSSSGGLQPFVVGIGNTEYLRVSTSGAVTLSGTGADLTVEGTGSSTFAGPVAVAGGATADANAAADDFVVGDLASSAVGLTILSTAGGIARIAATDTSTAIAGELRYTHGSGWRVLSEGGPVADFLGAAVQPVNDNAITLGAVGNRWSDIRAMAATIYGAVTLSGTGADLTVEGTGTSTFAGDVSLTGASPTLTVGDNTGSPTVVLGKSDAGVFDIDFVTPAGTGSGRWSIQYDASENFLLKRRTNGGVFIDNSVVVSPTTGNVSIANALTASGLTYPTVDGAAGDIVSTDGAGTLSLVTLGSLGLPDEGTVTDSTLRWSGTQWVENTNVISTSGGSLTLDSASPTLTVGDGTGVPNVNIDKSDGSGAAFGYLVAGVRRWDTRIEGNENFAIRRYDVAGTFVENTLTIDQATSFASWAGDLAVGDQLFVGASASVFTGTNAVEVVGNDGRVVIGSTASDATQKRARLLGQSYTNLNGVVTLLHYAANLSSTFLDVGGGDTSLNSPTTIRWWTSPDVTSTGTQKGQINATGQWIIGEGANPNSQTHVINGVALLLRDRNDDLQSKFFAINAEPRTSAHGAWRAITLLSNATANELRFGDPSSDAPTQVNWYVAPALDTAGTLHGSLNSTGRWDIGSSGGPQHYINGTGLTVRNVTTDLTNKTFEFRSSPHTLSDGEWQWLQVDATNADNLVTIGGDGSADSATQIGFFTATALNTAGTRRGTIDSTGLLSWEGDVTLDSASPTLTVGDGTGAMTYVADMSAAATNTWFSLRHAGTEKWRFLLTTGKTIQIVSTDGSKIWSFQDAGDTFIPDDVFLNSASPRLIAGDGSGSPTVRIDADGIGNGLLEFIKDSVVATDGNWRYNHGSTEVLLLERHNGTSWDIQATWADLLLTLNGDLTLLSATPTITVGDGTTVGGDGTINLRKETTGESEVRWQLGSSLTNGSFRIAHDASEHLLIQSREAGAWETVMDITGADDVVFPGTGAAGGPTFQFSDGDGDVNLLLVKSAGGQSNVSMFATDTSASDGDKRIIHDASEHLILQSFDSVQWNAAIDITDASTISYGFGSSSTHTFSGDIVPVTSDAGLIGEETNRFDQVWANGFGGAAQNFDASVTSSVNLTNSDFHIVVDQPSSTDTFTVNLPAITDGKTFIVTCVGDDDADLTFDANGTDVIWNNTGTTSANPTRASTTNGLYIIVGGASNEWSIAGPINLTQVVPA